MSSNSDKMPIKVGHRYEKLKWIHSNSNLHAFIKPNLSKERFNVIYDV